MRISRTAQQAPRKDFNKKYKSEPRDHKIFKMTPTPYELDDMKDGEAFRREAEIRLISSPYEYYSLWLARSGKTHIRTDGLEGFNGRDLLVEARRRGERKKNQAKGSEREEIYEKEVKPYIHRKKQAYEIIDYRYFHFVTPPGSKWQQVIPCPGPARCPLCSHNNPEIAERHFGGRKVWLGIGPSIYKEFQRLDAELSWQTVSEDPDLRGRPIRPGKEMKSIDCANCGTHILNISENTSIKQINEAYDNPELLCTNCGHKGYPDCTVELEGQKVGRNALQNIDIHITATGEKTTKGGRSTTQNVRYAISIRGFKTDPLVDAGEFGYLPLRLSDMGIDPADLGKPKVPKNWINPEDVWRKNFQTEDGFDMEGYVNAVLDEQANRTGLPRHHAISDELDTEIPF